MQWSHLIRNLALASLGAFTVGVPAAIAADRPPTARYAMGEEVDLALIVAEWKDRYPDIPVFACACNTTECDHTERWPFRRYDQYQLTVSLGPFNGAYTESLGFNCFDIETGKGLNEEISADPPETPEPVSPPTPTGTPAASVSADRTQLILTWPDNQTNAIDVSSWNINILDALDCETATQVPEKAFNGRFIASEPAVDPLTNNVAVAVVMEECFDTQQSAVFVIDPQGASSYALYRVQVPGERPFPNEFSSHGFSSITGLQYWDSTLLVRHGSASDAETLLVFRPDSTPAGRFVTCGIITPGEGATLLCPTEASPEP